ncbi:hypothetical protein ACLHIH_14135, partial [Marisediminicola sp. LYQ134]
MSSAVGLAGLVRTARSRLITVVQRGRIGATCGAVSGTSNVGGAVLSQSMKFEELTGQREDSPSDDGHLLHVELDPAIAEIEHGDALLDDLQLVQRDEARLAANRFVRVDEFRRHRERSSAAARDRFGMFARALRAEIAAALLLPERTAETLMARARALVDDLPTTLARLGEGRFSERHAVIIADESMTLDAAERAEFETQVLP